MEFIIRPLAPPGEAVTVDNPHGAFDAGLAYIRSRKLRWCANPEVAVYIPGRDLEADVVGLSDREINERKRAGAVVL